MTAFANFRAAAAGQPIIKTHGILPDTKSPGVQLTNLFKYQSYYDSTLLEAAMLEQSLNEPIVRSTLRRENVGGYSFGLHPSSQTLIAIQPILGGQKESPQAVVLRPGQIYRPNGRPTDEPGFFSGFNWGLPFGWLGGGLATLYVFPSADADVAWPGNAEILFHRQRMLVYGPSNAASIPGGVGTGRAPYNWPLRFPWPNAVRGATQLSQRGSPSVSISDPTRIMMSLRTPALANPVSMRIYFQSTNDLDLDSAGAPILTQVRFIDYVWGSYAAPNAALGVNAPNFVTQFPVAELTGEICRLAADDGGILLWDDSDTLTGLFVDIARYGKV